MIITIIINTIMVGLMSQLSYKQLEHHKTRSITDHDDLGRTWLMHLSIRNLNLLRPPHPHQCAHNNNSSPSVDHIHSFIHVSQCEAPLWGLWLLPSLELHLSLCSALKGWGLSFCSVHWDLISPALILSQQLVCVPLSNVQTLNIRCGPSVPTRKSQSRF